MAWYEMNSQPTVNRRWNAQFAFKVLFLIASTYLFSVAKTATVPHSPLQRRGPIGGNVGLRVLAIGDSITWGAQSTDSNGYRLHLRDMLVARGNDVDFVGNVWSGNFADWEHEGHRGFIIDQINESSDLGIYAAPNVVLLHAGTNDMYHNIDVEAAPTRIGNLIDKIYEHSPNAAVFVCQIIPSKTASIQARIDDFNTAIPSLVDKYRNNGKSVTLVSMNNALTTSDLYDFLHPNDGGYEKMANAWYAAIEEADEKGWIVEPGTAENPPTDANPESCQVSATTNGNFKPAWGKATTISGPDCPREQVRFFDLDGDGLKDYACVDPDTGSTTVWLNQKDTDGQVAWADGGVEVATGKQGRNGSGVFFADINGDSRGDYIYVDDNGDVYAWINRLNINGGTWQWQDLGKIAGGDGATSENLQMVDIDGDGRADFLIVSPSTGQMTAWLSNGADGAPDYSKLGVIASGASFSEGNTVILGDLTGEGRADYMIVGDGGKVNALISRLQADTLVPRWLTRFTFAEGPDGAEQDEVRLIDITGDGRVDYIRLDETGHVKLYANHGTGC
ncbi:SGNH hydrolase-type esterase domain-containing protein [Xylaria arbuscula]|nr:SGNH hydrolase-type esterase domain-containing protein [Xylaria arbuscula]